MSYNKICPHKTFTQDVASHQMFIISDDGINRRIRFGTPETISYRFDLLTWPGHLCISGDCGTYVFQRTYDMFDFFDGKDINPGYWGEKLLSISIPEGYREYSPKTFEGYVKSDFEQWEFSSEKEKELIWRQVEVDVIEAGHDGEADARHAVDSYKSDEGHQFIDFWDYDLEEYTGHYLWCLRAILWGVRKYKEEVANGKA